MAFEYQAFATLGVNLNRQKYAPLDISQVFNSQADLNYYISKGAVTEGVSTYWYTDADNKVVPYPYSGQIVALVIGKEVSILYLVEQDDGTFRTEEVGKTLLGDGTTIEIKDGKISLVGLDEVDSEGKPVIDTAKKYQPVLVEGKLTWQELSTVTVDGLDATIKIIEGEMDTAQSDIEDLKAKDTEIENKIGTVAEGKTVVKMIEEAQEAATYDDTDIKGRVKTIEDDYLKSADYTTLEQAIETAKSQAVSEAVTTVLGEGTSEDFDTLKEIADWILSDTTGAAALITRVTTIENDYLKGADKTELQGKITDLETFVGTLPEGAVSTTVVAYIHEVVDGLKIGDYAKAADLTALAERVTAVETAVTELTNRVKALEDVGSEKNVIAAVDEGEFTVDEATRKLSVKAVSKDKVTGLADALNGKVDKIEGSRLMTSDEAEKLEKLVLGENGEVSVSGTIAAGNVDGLADWISARAASLVGLSENNFTDAEKELLATVSKGANPNVIEIIKAGGTALPVNSEEKSVELPGALQAKLGLVIGTDAENGVSINDDHTMTINSVNVNKLVQTNGDTLVLDGGSSTN